MVWLLQKLKKATSGINDMANAYITMYNIISTLYCMMQGEQETKKHYFSRSKSNIAAVELTGGEYFFVPNLISSRIYNNSHRQRNLGWARVIQSYNFVEVFRWSLVQEAYSKSQGSSLSWQRWISYVNCYYVQDHEQTQWISTRTRKQ